MDKVKIYPLIIAVFYGGISGIPIGLMLYNQDQFTLWDAIVIGAFISGIFGIIGYSLGESIWWKRVKRKKYEDKIKQWESEGYKVEELKKKWGFK